MVEQLDLLTDAEIDPILDKEVKWMNSIIESCAANIEVLAISKNDSRRFVGREDHNLLLYEIVDYPTKLTDYESAKGCILTIHKISERKLFSKEFKQVCRF